MLVTSEVARFERHDGGQLDNASARAPPPFVIAALTWAHDGGTVGDGE